MHTTKIEVLTEHLPIRIEFIESAEKVDELMPTLYDMVTDGVIEVQDTKVVKVASKERPSPPKGPHTEMRGTARLMRIYMGESDKWQGEPLYEAIVKRLRLMDIAGATVYRGILGYGAKGHTHKSGRLPFSHDLPVMISVVDSEEKLAKAMNEIESMMQDGIIVLSDVDVIRLVHSRPAKRSLRMRTVKKAKLLRLHFGESDRYNGKPLYEAIVNRCKELKIAGATVFRGLEGYGETAEIHRHHLIRKDQPIVVTIVDTPENLARLIPEVEEMMDTGMIATSDVEYMRIEKPQM
jgi:PII-like signaling protein